MNRIVVFVPGIMGSELWLGEKQIWPGTLSNLIFRYPYISTGEQVQPSGDELLSPDLTPGDVIREFSVSSQYGHLFGTLADCSFKETRRTLYPFAYDWRVSNAESASRLAERIETIATEWEPKGDFQILLVAHSMGGLVSRHYLESGHFTTRKGFRQISSLICLATPHFGSPLALTACLGIERRLFLREDQVYKLSQQTAYPSLYQLLPPRRTPFAWPRRLDDQLDPIDIYEPTVFESLCALNQPDRKLNPLNVQSALSFHAELSVAKRPEGVRYFFFAGTRQRSATTSFLIPNGPLLDVQNREVDDGGDGTVPFWSASVSGIQVAAVGGEHGAIYKNEELIEVLKALLGARGMLAAVPGAPELSVRDRVVDPGAWVNIALTFRPGIERVSGEIRVERLQNDQSYAAAAAPSEFSYRGPFADRFYLMVKAPDLHGIYRVAFYRTGEEVVIALDDLFVQAQVLKP